MVDADLEGIVAKHLADVYQPKLVRWHKVLNRGYSQRRGRAKWFRERRARYADDEGGSDRAALRITGKTKTPTRARKV